MQLDALFALSVFALVASITPGPNNFMLLASGVNFGFRATIPHMLGISIGFLMLVTAVGLGLAKVFAKSPVMYEILKWVGAMYMLYLAWRIANAEAPTNNATAQSNVNLAATGTFEAVKHTVKPLGFWGAAAFQWVNPKAWIMAVSAFTTYMPVSTSYVAVMTVAVIFAMINLPSVSLWVLFGSSLRHVFKVRRNLLIFNYSMAGLLVASLYPLLSI